MTGDKSSPLLAISVLEPPPQFPAQPRCEPHTPQQRLTPTPITSYVTLSCLLCTTFYSADLAVPHARTRPALAHHSAVQHAINDRGRHMYRSLTPETRVMQEPPGLLQRSLLSPLAASPVPSTSQSRLDDDDGDGALPCTCIRIGGLRRRRRQRPNVVAAATTATVMGLGLLAPPVASASPVKLLTRRQLDKQPVLEDYQYHPASTSRAREFTAATRAPTASTGSSSPFPTRIQANLVDDDSDRLVKRSPLVLPKYEYTDGEWIVNPTKTWRGRPVLPASTTTTTSSAHDDALEDTSPQVDGGAVLIGFDDQDSSAASQQSTPTPTFTPTHATPKIAAAAEQVSSAASSALSAADAATALPSPSSFKVPSGWAPTPRETSFYAVPIIVTMSVLIALSVAGTVIGSVIWRRKQRNKEARRRKRRAARRAQKEGLTVEAAEEKPAGGRRIVDRIRFGLSPRRDGGGNSQPRPASDSDGDSDNGDAAAPISAAVAPAGAALTREQTRSSVSSNNSGTRRTAGQVRQSVISGANRLRQRQRRRRRQQERVDADGSGDEDEGTALTASESRGGGGSPNDTLTARLQARLRRRSTTTATNSATNEAGPSTVFSRDLSDDRNSSLALSRSSSRLSLPLSLSSSLSRNGPVEATTSVLPLRRTPSHRSSTSSFGLGLGGGLDVPLPAMGPPAYRPAGSTVADTRRGVDAAPPSSSALAATPSGTRASRNVRRVPVPSLVVDGHAEGMMPSGSSRREAEDASGEAGEDDGEWHWPNEKRTLASTSDSSSSAPVASTSAISDDLSPPPLAPAPDDHEEEEEEPAPYAAHIATDDKALLARIRERTARAGVATAAPLVEGSAPELFEGDEDGFGEDAFDHYGASTPSISARVVPSPSAPDQHLPPAPSLGSATLSALPAPPRPVSYASAHTYALPVYTPDRHQHTHMHSPASRDVLSLASAPPPSDSDTHSHDDEVDWRALEEGSALPARGWDGRTESAEI